MDNLQKVAIAKAVQTKVASAAGKELDAGTYEVDTIFRVQGTFRKGDEYEQNKTNKINWQLGFAVALSKVNNETRDKIVGLVLDAMSNGKESDEHKLLADQIKAEIQPKLDDLKGTTKEWCSGKINATLVAEVVGTGKIEKIG